MDDLTPISFGANYRRYTPEASELLMRISKALGAIGGARVLPAVADQLRVSARVGTVHYSTLIEGNELPIVEAERAARGQLAATTRAKIELVNYVSALDLLDERLEANLQLTPDFLKDLHGVATKGLGRDEDPHFKPHHEGEWRDGVAVVVDRITNTVLHEGPPKDEVPGRVEGMFDWLDAKVAANAEPAFVLAGVLHYGITEIHPFADGNGRAARLFQTALLMKSGVLPGRMFSFERYYAEDRPAYYAALRSVRANTFNMEAWLAYFLRGLAEEYERVAATIADLTALVTPSGSSPLRLNPNQERALAGLRIEGRREFSRRDYEVAAGVGRSSAGKDLNELVRHAALVPRGSGPATRYAFAAASKPPLGGRGRGRKRSWTEARIERELRAFVEGRSEWPRPEEFRSSGRGPLYAAASRAGGISRWRRLIGL
ncbi:MAG TPA: Fic family protein [Thermoleophilaceae bacterium]|nr:Fic family protein [Thermoleophilaceae bacterium]